jgi:hypothetical protein
MIVNSEIERTGEQKAEVLSRLRKTTKNLSHDSLYDATWVLAAQISGYGSCIVQVRFPSYAILDAEMEQKPKGRTLGTT